MKMVSKLALGAMLSLSAVSLAATPANAQDKKDKKGKEAEKAPGLQISPEYRKAASAAEAAIKAGDWATAETQTAAAEGLAQNDDEKFYAASSRLQVEAHKGSSEGMIPPLDLLLASPRTLPGNLPTLNFYRGNASFTLKKYAEALPYLLKARELGNTDKDLPLLLVQIYANTGNIPASVAEMNKAIEAEHAAGRKPPEAWYDYGIDKVYHSGDRTATAQWMKRKIADYPTIKNWRQVIVNFSSSENAKKEPLDRRQKVQLYRLMRATGALADQNDFVDYAQAAVNSGLPWETISVIDEGRKSGKLPQGEPDSTKLYSAGQTAVKGEGSLDALATAAGKAATGKPSAETGDAFLASANYAKALSLYDQALTKGGVNTDEVNLNRGVALFNLGRTDEALTAFAAVQGTPLSDIAGFWTTYIKMPVKPS